MTLSDIVAITGMPGLFKIASRRNDGLIVTSLIDDKTQFVPGRTHLFTTLDNITIYTSGEPVAIKEVLASIKKNEQDNIVPDAKNDDELKKWMEGVVPTYDKEKVHLSDMKKLVKWYNALNANGLIEELTTDKPVEAAEGAADDTGEKKEVKKDLSSKKEGKPKAMKSDKSSKGNTKPAPSAKKITAPRKAQ